MHAPGRNAGRNEAPKYRFLGYALARNNKDLIRVVVNQSDAVKAARDAKAHSVSFGESWLYMVTDEKQQILIGHYINGKLGPTTAPNRGNGERRKQHNPPVPGAVLIYENISRIEATKKREHTYGGKLTRAGQNYFHDFNTPAEVWGLKNGSLLIVPKK